LTTTNTEITRVGFNQVDIIRITSTNRFGRRTRSMVIILSTLIVGTQIISTDIDITTDLNKTRGSVSLIRGRGDESRGENTSTRSVNVGLGTEGNCILFRISNSVDILLTTVIGLVTGSRGKEDTEILTGTDLNGKTGRLSSNRGGLGNSSSSGLGGGGSLGSSSSSSGLGVDGTVTLFIREMI
jgi:hypothetical protein